MSRTQNKIRYDYAAIQKTSSKCEQISVEMDAQILKIQQRMQELSARCKGSEIEAAMRNLDQSLPLLKKDANALNNVATETSKASRKMQQTEQENAARLKRVKRNA